MPKQKNPHGMGSYVKLSNGRVRWRQMVDGQLREITAKDIKSLQEKVRHVKDAPIVKSKLKVKEWIDMWLESVQSLRKPATYNQYKYLCDSHICPKIANKSVRSIKKVDVQSVITEMNKKGLSTQTMKLAKIVMNLLFNEALENGFIPSNPVIKIDIPRKQRKERKTLSVDEIVRIYKAMSKSRWIWSAKFMLVTGIRRGELLALKWSDIDYSNKRIVIQRSNSDSGMGETKDADVHYVPLSGKTIEYLEKQKVMLEKEFNPILYNDELKKSDLVFPNIKGKLTDPHSYYTMFSRFAKNAGVKASPHCLRHTFVYFMRHKLSLKELQLILGHSETTSTLDIYGNMLNDTHKGNEIDTAFDVVDEAEKKMRLIK